MNDTTQGCTYIIFLIKVMSTPSYFLYLDCNYQTKVLYKFINPGAFGTTGFNSSPFLPPALGFRDKAISTE